jgi:UDP-N-acetylglucosamine 3-dehydrogenase
VLCDTPAAYTMTEALHMARIASRAKKTMCVALYQRFVSDYKYVHDYINAGYLGKIKTIFANRRTPPIWGDGWNDYFIMDLMLHDIDYVCWLLGVPRRVTGKGSTHPGGGWDHVTLLLDYGETYAVIEGSGIMPPSFPFSTGFRIVGEKGAIDVNWRWGGEAPVSEVTLYPGQGKPEVLSIPDYDPYEAECRYFIDALQGKTDPGLLGIATACDSLGIASAGMESLMKNGQPVEL